MKHQITLNDRTQIEITQEQADKIFKLSSNPNIKTMLIDNQLIAFSAIATIKPIEDRKSLPLPQYKPFTREKRIRALECMLNGFKSHFGNRKMNVNARIILNKMETSLENTINSKSEMFNNPLIDIL